VTGDEHEMLIKARDKLKTDLDWRGPRGREQKLVVLDRGMAIVVLAAIDHALEAIEHDRERKP
jgi:hypothetical protein